MNTLIELMYRCAGNYKHSLELVLPGEITDAEIAGIGDNLEMGVTIIAHQVGLPSPIKMNEGGINAEMDHVWTEMCAWEDEIPAAASLHTDKKATHEDSVHDVAYRISNARWDVAKEHRRLGL